LAFGIITLYKNFGVALKRAKILLFGIVILIIILLLYIIPVKSEQNSQFIIGTSLPIGGFEDMDAKNLLKGFFSYFEKSGDKKIDLLVLPDKNIAKKALNNISKLSKNESVNALVFPMTHIDPNEIQALKENKLWIFPNHLKDISPKYEAEFRLIIDDLKKRDFLDRVSLFYEDSVFNRNLAYEFGKILNKNNSSLIAIGAYKPNTLSIGQALFEIVPSRAKAIIILAPPKAASVFIKQAKETNLIKSNFYLLSFTNANEILKRVGSPTDNINYIHWILKDGFECNNSNFCDGYLYAKILSSELKKADARDLIRVDWQQRYIDMLKKPILKRAKNDN